MDALVRHYPNVVGRQALLWLLYQDRADEYRKSSGIRVRIASLRRIIEPYGGLGILWEYYGRGYRLLMQGEF